MPSVNIVSLLPFRQPAMVTKNELLLLEAFDIIGCTTTLGVFYGLAFSLYYLCASSLYLDLQNPDKRRHTMFSLGFISLLLFCATSCVVLEAMIIQQAYINHADFPGGPFEYELSYGLVIEKYQETFTILDFIIEVLTMAIQVSDQPSLSMLWKLMEHTTLVDLAPVDNLECNTICCCSHHPAWLAPLGLHWYVNINLVTIEIIDSWYHMHPALDIPVEIVFDFVSLGIPNSSMLAMDAARYIISICLTVLVTGFIAVHLLLVRRQHTKIMGKCLMISLSMQ